MSMVAERHSAAAPASSTTKTKSAGRRVDRSLYSNPVPILLPLSEHPGGPSAFVVIYTLLKSLLLIGYRRIQPTPAPPYQGILVPETGCVWVLPASDAASAESDYYGHVKKWELWSSRSTTVTIAKGVLHVLGLGLWRGGFFGKATLSRGEPTWQSRLSDDTQGQPKGESLATSRRLQRRAQKQSTGSHARNVLLRQALTVDPERYQLMPEEAFFLAHCLGILAVKESEEGCILSAAELWKRQRNINSETTDVSKEFAVRYAAYHYYRSRGWVVKSGIKFGTDFVLYKKGPIFRHSDFAVVVVPAFADEATSDRERRSWLWALSINRVCAQVSKPIILCHVVLPSTLSVEDLNDPACIRKLSIWDVCLRRWVPQKTRD
ncbi:hypothetical protein BC832DRAFT_274837 [Gaertneriomyces semiglobifer]|nr:hypothetical protein BC832DRAFT_274837 [Gaertneriomyces semiglobifer]